jgi:uncharacterized membrane protein
MQMAHLRMTAHFEAPIEEVYDLGLDFKRYPEWNVTYREVKEIVGLPPAVGTKIHVVTQFLGRTMEGWGEVVELDRPLLMKVSGEAQGGKLSFTDRLTPAGAGTDIVIEADYELPAGIFGKIADKVFVEKAVERDLRHSVENFKALVEARIPVLV